MPQQSINYFDVYCFAVLLGLSMLGLKRGFIAEIVSLVAWILATLAPLALFPITNGLFGNPGDYASNNNAASLGVFLLTFLLVKKLGSIISMVIQHPMITYMDHMLGAAFGLVRAYWILCIIVVTIMWSLSTDVKPGWVENSKMMPLMIPGAKALMYIVPAQQQRAFMNEAQEMRAKIIGFTTKYFSEKAK